MGILVAVFGAALARQISARGPRVWVAFAIGAVAFVASGVLSPAAAGEALDAGVPVLVFLASLFALAGALERSGALAHLARWMLHRTVRTESLSASVFLLFGIASAFVVNDALILIAVPILLDLSRRIRVDPKPLLLTAAFAVTVGSALTPMGNPQNLLVSLSSGIRAPVVTFLAYLLVPIAASLAAGAWIVRRAYAAPLRAGAAVHAELRRTAVPLVPPGPWPARLFRAPVLVIFPAAMLALIGIGLASTVAHTPEIPVWVPPTVAAVLVVALTPDRPSIVRSIDLRILALFAGLFVVVAGAIASGVIGAIESILPIPGPAAPAALSLPAITVSSLVGSQLFSNVPWVGLQIPLLAQLGYSGATPLPWLALAAGSTLAGNVTLLGAASNLILVDRAEEGGVRIRLGEFARIALPIAAVSVLLTVGALGLGV
ncbi:MAG: SLC13 family permease [Thermoplasmata archaeon]